MTNGWATVHSIRTPLVANRTASPPILGRLTARSYAIKSLVGLVLFFKPLRQGLQYRLWEELLRRRIRVRLIAMVRHAVNGTCH